MVKIFLLRVPWYMYHISESHQARMFHRTLTCLPWLPDCMWWTVGEGEGTLHRFIFMYPVFVAPIKVQGLCGMRSTSCPSQAFPGWLSIQRHFLDIIDQFNWRLEITLNSARFANLFRVFAGNFVRNNIGIDIMRWEECRNEWLQEKGTCLDRRELSTHIWVSVFPNPRSNPEHCVNRFISFQQLPPNKIETTKEKILYSWHFLVFLL